MRIIEEREFFIYFDDDELPPPFWSQWGGFKRRVRLQPKSVIVKWKREGCGEWLLWTVWVGGRRLHKQTNQGISERFHDCSGQTKPMPEWLAAVVESTKPEPAAVIA